MTSFIVPRRGFGAVRTRVCAVALILLAAGCASSPSNGRDEPLRPVSPDAFRAESGLGSYLAGRFAARALNDTTAAADFFAQSLMEDPDNEILTHRTMQLMLADGRIENGVALAQRVVRFAPNDGLANLVLALEAVKAGDWVTAQRRVGEMSKSGFNQLIGPIILAWSRYGQGQTDAALEALTPLRENSAFALFRNFNTGLIHELAGRPTQAEEAYKQAYQDAGGSSLRIAEAYGSLLERVGNSAEARKIYMEYLARTPDNPGVQHLLDEMSIGRGAQRPLVTTPAEAIAETLYGAALVLARNDRSDSGEIYIHLALHLRPDFVLARTLLGDLHENDGRWAEAIEVYRSIDRSSPYSWPTRLRTVWAYNRLDRKAEATAMLQQMAAEQPNRTDALVTLGDVLRGEDRFAEAAAAYGQALARLPRTEARHWSIFYARGIAHERSKQWAQAEADFLKALELKPEDPLVLNYLGYSWVDQGLHLDRALGMIERAVRQRPTDGYIVDSLGWAFYRLGRFEDASIQLERAVELRPEDPTINDHLGDSYWMIGRQTEARTQWRRALSLKPDAALVPAIQEKLARGLLAPARPRSAQNQRSP